ncbi:type II toxin-antitoxin system HipA family toxin [Variovorax sp. PBL-E5]|uniref:type II toxin-antitoxin system HipA family toxin n=1 Tax=Variovorax sp. PBL-E5 TaxID=434014 RepID=UPI00131683FC|nr:type II toxin-antitoxin system HipA family toxin [Variovorax sp. PBL-E5]VTU26206.1 putative DNA-binding transcriptional regulator [Variovorax sp. PBL-E5]
MATRKPRTTGYKHVDSVEIHLWGERVGVVALDPGYGFYAFRYTPQFQAGRIEPSPLQMPLAADRTFLFTDLPVETYKRLPAMLNDALPDDFGNALINRWMADRGISPQDITALDRLAYMNNRAMGALQFKPARGPATQKPMAIQLSRLVVEARKAVAGSLENDDHANAALRSIIEVGTSAGGARAKAVIAWNRESEEIRAGQLEAPPGFEHWLLKFDGMGMDNELGTSQGYGRIEYAYHLMAREAGIDMTECRLLQENGRAHFMTRRFDREDADVRHHMQTLCAMAHLDYKKKGTNSYAQLFDTMNRLGLPYEDKEEAFRRMVFNVMGRNCDDHTKNFSFRLRQGHPWELSPAYDLNFAHNPKGEWTSQHLMAVNGKFKDFTEDDLLAEAERFGIGTAPRVIDRVRSAIGAWRSFAAQAQVGAEQVEQIGSLLLPLK